MVTAFSCCFDSFGVFGQPQDLVSARTVGDCSYVELWAVQLMSVRFHGRAEALPFRKKIVLSHERMERCAFWD